jgi:SPP1 family predicted phage head-tail adaptor
MLAGKFKQRITIVSQVTNDDGIGGALITYSDLITVWANVTPFSQSQSLQYAEINDARGYNIELRYLRQYDITTNHAIEYDGVMLMIHSVIDEDDKRLKIVAFEQ